MSGNKRFTITLDFEEHHRQIRDNGHVIMGCFVEPQAEVIVDLLNRLNDENRWLKYENEILSEELEQCKAVIEKRWSEYLRKKGLIE